MKKRAKKTAKRKQRAKSTAKSRKKRRARSNPSSVPVRVANPKETKMARKKRKSGRRRRSNPSRSRRRHRATGRRHNPSHGRRPHRRRRRHNPSLKGALMNAGKAVLIGTGVTVVGIGGMWALGKIPTTSTGGVVAKFAITGIVGGGLVGMISPLAGALIALTFLNVAGGAIVNALTTPKQQPAAQPTQGLANGAASGLADVKRLTPIGSVYADDLGAILADNLGRVGLAQHARRIIEEGRTKGLNDREIAAIVRLHAA